MKYSQLFRALLVLIMASFLIQCATDRSNSKTTPASSNNTVVNTKPQVSESPTPGSVRLWIGDNQVDLEIAMTNETRGRGLSMRHKLAEDDGMIFVYRTAEPKSFWMKNTWIALDIAFIDEDRRVSHVVSLDPPPPGCSDANMPRAKSLQPARYVIEMNRGWFEKHAVGVGTRIRFSPALERLVEGASN